MKRIFLVLAVISFMFALPMYGNADIIGNVTVQEFYSGPTGAVTFPGPQSGTYYLDYDVKLNGVGPSEAFCVEKSNGPSSAITYTLLRIDSGLAAFGLDVNRYLAAAWVAQHYYNGTDDQKAAAQIAVWELIFDGTASRDLTTGAFTSSNGFNGAAATILGLVPGNGELVPSTTWALAVNPTLTGPVQITDIYAQNYLVQHVPEPTTLLLLGIGMIGIAGIRRKINS